MSEDTRRATKCEYVNGLRGKNQVTTRGERLNQEPLSHVTSRRPIHKGKGGRRVYQILAPTSVIVDVRIPLSRSRAG